MAKVTNTVKNSGNLNTNTNNGGTAVEKKELTVADVDARIAKLTERKKYGAMTHKQKQLAIMLSPFANRAASDDVGNGAQNQYSRLLKVIRKAGIHTTNQVMELALILAGVEESTARQAKNGLKKSLEKPGMEETAKVLLPCYDYLENQRGGRGSHPGIGEVEISDDELEGLQGFGSDD